MSKTDPSTLPPWGADSRIRTTLGAIGLVIALTASAVAAWVSTRGTVSDHTRTLDQHEARLGTIEQRAREDHDILVEIRSDQKAMMRELSAKRERDR